MRKENELAAAQLSAIRQDMIVGRSVFKWDARTDEQTLS